MPDHPIDNLLLQRLSPADGAAVRAITTPVRFSLGDTLSAPGDPLTHMHFVVEGIISAVGETTDGRSSETHMIGLEGVSGIWASAVPASSYSRHVCQVSGHSLRVDAGQFRALATDRPELRAVLATYGAHLQCELEQSSTCNALHRSEQRLAKWLLRCHDRVAGDVLFLTQEYMATMLGAQRTTVNEAAQTLHAAGALSYSRGKVTILDRAALERAACECYPRLDGARALEEAEVQASRAASTSSRVGMAG